MVGADSGSVDFQSRPTRSAAHRVVCNDAGGTRPHIARIVCFGYYGRMKTVPATEAKNRLGAILDAAQREPIVIRRQDRDIAVLLSMADYERLRSANVAALLELRDQVAAEAAAAGLTEERLAEILNTDGT